MDFIFRINKGEKTPILLLADFNDNNDYQESELEFEEVFNLCKRINDEINYPMTLITIKKLPDIKNIDQNNEFTELLYSFVGICEEADNYKMGGYPSYKIYLESKKMGILSYTSYLKAIELKLKNQEELDIIEYVKYFKKEEKRLAGYKEKIGEKEYERIEKIAIQEYNEVLFHARSNEEL